MTPAVRFRASREALRWPIRRLADIIGQDERTVRRWENGQYPPPVHVLIWIEGAAAWLIANPAPVLPSHSLPDAVSAPLKASSHE
jgi:transcriptional regulator with XRE-family HTH domain